MGSFLKSKFGDLLGILPGSRVDSLFNFGSDLSCFDIGQCSHDCNIILPVNCWFLVIGVEKKRLRTDTIFFLN